MHDPMGQLHVFACANKFPFEKQKKQQPASKPNGINNNTTNPWKEPNVSRILLELLSFCCHWKKKVKANTKQPAAHVDKCSTTELYIIHSVNILFGVLLLGLACKQDRKKGEKEILLMIFRYKSALVFSPNV